METKILPKHTWQRTVLSMALGIGILGSISACSQPVSPSPENSVSASNSAASGLPYANDGKAVNNGNGSYLQTSIDDKDPAMQYNESIVSADLKAKYSEDEIAEAQKTVVRFIAEQTIDSTVQGGGSSSEWFEKHQDAIAPDFREEAKRLVADPKSGFLIDNPNRKSAGYELAYDEKSARVDSRSIDVTKIILASKDRPLVSANIEYSLKTKEGKLEKASGTISYAVTEIEGRWLISGYESKVAITPFATDK